MKIQKKILAQIIVFLAILLSSCQVFATDILNYLGEIQFSEDYIKYLESLDSNEEVKNTAIFPRMYEIPKIKMTIINPFKMATMLGSTTDSMYSLKDSVPENMVVKNQKQTNSCWTFSSLAALESNLALSDKINQRPTMVYDFSERHMEYATSKTFLDGTNPNGFNREVGDGGVSQIVIPYLTNGTGAIAESEMEFENNEDSIYMSEILNKNVITQVNDIVTFPSYSSTDDTTQIMKQMKEHIKNYGAIDAGIYGASLNSGVYNNDTGAIYCDNSTTYPINHAVAIVGWDDTYSVENFLESKRPANKGAWIIKNSWGTQEQYTLEEMKEYIFENYYDACIKNGWKTASQIPDDNAIYNFELWGFTVENKVATLKIGDEGFMYVSYEDANIYKQLTGIQNAQSEVTYENIYQYDQYGGALSIKFTKLSKLYLASEFDKKTTGTEYLTQVSIMAPEKYECKVYVNPNGDSKSTSDLQQVQLKAGDTEVFEAGYHTIEFAEPIKITGDKFVVALEIQGFETNSISSMIEVNYGDFYGDDGSAVGQIYNNVTVESGKCFYTVEDDWTSNKWVDTSTMFSSTNGQIPNFDTTIKAFTTSKVLESIEVTTPPTKTEYLVGEDFDKTGMVVNAKYTNGTSEEITDFSISDGTNLQLGQTSVTVGYEGKVTTQTIDVVENSIKSIAIKTPPTKTEYFAGDDFDATGMVIVGVYRDGTTKEITDYTVTDGTALKNGQTTVTISYEDKTTTQDITVKVNSVLKIEIKQGPAYTDYVVGQNFDTEGMIVEATYENGTVKEIDDYTIQDGTNLKLGQTTVTIEYEGQTAIVEITVEEKTVISISVKTNPTKMEYIQNKEDLDLAGGVIEILYNDDSKRDMNMTSEEIIVSGFDNKELGTKAVTLTYEEKTTQFDVKIVEEAKPVNSNFDNMQGNVKRIRVYTFTDENKEEYVVLNVELDNIVKATENDEMEYYYHLSSNPNEVNITDWVKMNIIQDENDKIQFEINTKDISNYEELLSANTIYLYVKEVAIRNNIKQEKITLSFSLSVEDLSIEEYLDGEKVAEVNPGTIIGTGSTPAEDSDDTLASEIIPNAGKNMLLVLLMLAVVIIGRIAYLRYKDIQIK